MRSPTSSKKARTTTAASAGQSLARQSHPWAAQIDGSGSPTGVQAAAAAESRQRRTAVSTQSPYDIGSLGSTCVRH